MRQPTSHPTSQLHLYTLKIKAGSCKTLQEINVQRVQHTQDKQGLLWSTEHPTAHKLSVMGMFLEEMSIITDVVDRADEEEHSRKVPANYSPWERNNPKIPPSTSAPSSGSAPWGPPQLITVIPHDASRRFRSILEEALHSAENYAPSLFSREAASNCTQDRESSQFSK